MTQRLDTNFNFPVETDEPLRRALEDVFSRLVRQINMGAAMDSETVTGAAVIGKEVTLVDASATGTVVCTLQPALNWQDRVAWVRTLSGTALLVPQSGETLDSTATVTVAASSALAIVSDGANWHSMSAAAAGNGLSHTAVSPTTADITAATGNWYYATIAGLTADRNFVLPDTAAVGDMIGLYIADGDPDYGLKAKTAATGSELNGVNVGATASDKFYLFSKGEYLVFRCVKAGGAGDTDWAVEDDGRLKNVGNLFRSTITSGTPWADSTWTKITFDGEGEDIGDVNDLTNNEIVLRRPGLYRANFTVQGGTGTVADGSAWQNQLRESDGLTTIFQGAQIRTGATAAPGLHSVAIVDFTTLPPSGIVRHYGHHTAGASQDFAGSKSCTLSLEEILTR